MKSIADKMLTRDWNTEVSDDAKATEKNFKNLCRKMVEGDDISGLQFYTPPTGESNDSSESGCTPLAVQRIMSKRSQFKGLGCQVCKYEGRGNGIIKSTVICLRHRLRLCTDTHVQRRISFDGNEVTNLTWMAPDHTLTCWEKAHQFYIPMGLFRDNVDSVTVEEIANKKIKFQCMCLSSKPYKRKLEAMGQEQEVQGPCHKQVESVRSSCKKEENGEKK